MSRPRNGWRPVSSEQFYRIISPLSHAKQEIEKKPRDIRVARFMLDGWPVGQAATSQKTRKTQYSLPLKVVRAAKRASKRRTGKGR